MRKLQHLLGRLNLSRLKKFTALIPKTRDQWTDTLAYASAHRNKLEKLLPPDFSWAYLYELEVKEMLILNLASLGLLDKLMQAHRDGLDLNQYLMDETIRESETENDESDWSGGHGGVFSKADVIAISYATQASSNCVSIYGHYLNELVKQVRDGTDLLGNAFFYAISIDRTVLSCPTFAARLSRAEFFGERKFLFRLRKAVKGKPHDALLQHRDLRLVLQLFHEMKILAAFTLEDADLLFIKELKLYQDNGSDPAHSLMRFIQRWKADKQSTT
jgi:hypothetical protein